MRFGARRHRIEWVENVTVKGRLSISVYGPDGELHDYREGDNVICTTGWTALTAALVWAGIQDQATNLGVLSGTYLTPLYGAVGNGVGTPVKADTQLFNELSRQTVGGGAATPATATIAAQATWTFFFPQPASPWSLTEAGVFANASSTVNTGSMIDHWQFSPSVSVPTLDTAVLQVSLGFGP